MIGTLAGTGLVAGATSGTLPMMGIGVASAIFSDQATGGFFTITTKAVALSMPFSWIPSGPPAVSLFVEGAKGAGISGLTQMINTGEVDWNVFAKSGFFSAGAREFQLLGAYAGISAADMDFYNYVLPTVGAAVLSISDEDQMND